ncbi:MAG TPA: hypothetical protein VMF08_15180 [Candidatus Sulfotelmatobacter sp.]|nr:hypothetical protein [Candidatus Sulfotelmatobacter sp.]
MSAERALFDAYREWRRLARACQKAISQKNWPLLFQCQSAIKDIQSFTASATRQVRAEWSRSKADCAVRENELRALILELKELVESNQKQLQLARAAALSRREQLEKVGQNLRRIQGAYGSAIPPAWTRLS